MLQSSSNENNSLPHHDIDDESEDSSNSEDEFEPCQSLFSPHHFPSAQKCFEYDFKTTGFDFIAFRHTQKLNFYDSIKLLNFIRTRTIEEREEAVDTIREIEQNQSVWRNDCYLRPVLNNDSLLYSFENTRYIEHNIDENTDDNNTDRNVSLSDDDENSVQNDLLDENYRLRQQVNDMQKSFQRFALQDDGEQTTLSSSLLPTKSISTNEDNINESVERGYIACYDDIGMHEEMLRDRIRTDSYANFIERNAETLFKGRIVLDIGCGTGILCLLAARAGASKVYGIDQSSIIRGARRIVRDNGYEDVIELFESRVEDCVLPIHHVDVIISEWMGYFLLYESMLSTVLYARDQWLRQGGLMCPRKAVMYIQGVDTSTTDASPSSKFWDNVYGFNFSSIAPSSRLQRKRGEAMIAQLDSDCGLTNIVDIKSLDLMNVSDSDLDFVSSFELSCNDKVSTRRLDALTVFFNVTFGESESALVLSTAPQLPTTHWKQTILFLDTPLKLNKGDVMKGELRAHRPLNARRHYEISVQLYCNDTKLPLLLYCLGD